MEPFVAVVVLGLIALLTWQVTRQACRCDWVDPVEALDEHLTSAEGMRRAWLEQDVERERFP